MNGPQSDTYNIMLASLGTTPLKIIYAVRLEYAPTCVLGGVNETCGERCKGGCPPLNSFDYLSFTFLEQLPMAIWEVNSFPELQNIKESEAVYCF
jgi:hypothetical protein